MPAFFTRAHHSDNHVSVSVFCNFLLNKLAANNKDGNVFQEPESVKKF